MSPTPNIPGISPTAAALNILRRHVSGWAMDVIEGLVVAFGLAEFVDGKFHKHLGKPQPLAPQHGVTYQSLMAVAPTSQAALVNGWVVRLSNTKRNQFISALGTRAEKTPGVVRPTSNEFMGALDTIRRIAQASSMSDEHGDDARTKKAIELNMLHPDDNFITHFAEETPKEIAKLLGLIPKFFAALYNEIATRLGHPPQPTPTTANTAVRNTQRQASQTSPQTRIVPTATKIFIKVLFVIAAFVLCLILSVLCAVNGQVILAVLICGVVTFVLAAPITVVKELGLHEAYRAMTAVRMCTFAAIFIAYLTQK